MASNRSPRNAPASGDDPLCSPSTAGIGVSLVPGATGPRRSPAWSRSTAVRGRTPLPSVVNNLGQIGSTPWYLAGFLACSGVAGLAHALTTGSGRRDHDLAVTRAVGFRPAPGGGHRSVAGAGPRRVRRVGRRACSAWSPAGWCGARWPRGPAPWSRRSCRAGSWLAVPAIAVVASVIAARRPPRGGGHATTGRGFEDGVSGMTVSRPARARQ